MIDYIILFVLALISFLHFLSYLTDKTLFIICCFFFVIRIFDHFFGFSYYFSFFIPIVYYSKLFFLQKEKSIYLIGFIKRFKYLIFFLFINLAISCLVAVNFHDYSDFNFLTLIFNIFKNFLRLISIILLIKYIIDSKKYINCGFYAILIATFISAITEIYTFIFGHNLQYIITGIGHQYDIAAGLKAFRISGLSYEPRYMSFVSIISIIILLTNFLYKNKLPTNKELFLTFFYFLIFLLTFSTSGYFLFILIIAFIIPSFKRFFTLNLKKIIFSFVSFFFIVFI